MHIEFELNGWAYSYDEFENFRGEENWDIRHERQRLILNLGSSLSSFFADHQGLIYIGAPMTGEYGWVPSGAPYYGSYGIGPTTFLQVSPPSSMPEPIWPVLGGADVHILRMGRAIRDAMLVNQIREISELGSNLWRRLKDLENRPKLRRGTPPSDSLVSHVMTRAALDPRSFRTVEHLSYVIGCSVDGLNRAFIERLGMTTAQYLEHMRLKNARRMLASSTKSIGEIAFASGFSSQAHMSDRMRIKLGVSPKAFRLLSREPRLQALQRA